MYMQTSTYQQVNHYYPYGGLMGESTGGDVQRYKYKGKELDRMHGLDWYDYGARHYDAAIISWPTMDPLCEKYYSISPYVYCHNNPIRSIDINGKADYFTTSGSFIKTDNNNDDPYIYIQTADGNVKLSDYTFAKGEKGLRPMMRIAYYYYNLIDGNIKGSTIGVDARHLKGTNSQTLAYTENNHIRLMVHNGKFGKDLEQIYNMRSTLQHEVYHYNDKKKLDGYEVRTIISQMNDSDFSKTSASYKAGVAGYLQSELVKLYETSLDMFYKYIDAAQRLLHKYGAKSTFEYINGGNQISF